MFLVVGTNTTTGMESSRDTTRVGLVVSVRTEEMKRIRQQGQDKPRQQGQVFEGDNKAKQDLVTEITGLWSLDPQQASKLPEKKGSWFEPFLRRPTSPATRQYKGHCPEKSLDSQLTCCCWTRNKVTVQQLIFVRFFSLHPAFLLFYNLTFSFLTGTPPSQWQEQSDQGSINLRARM